MESNETGTEERREKRANMKREREEEKRRDKT